MFHSPEIDEKIFNKKNMRTRRIAEIDAIQALKCTESYYDPVLVGIKAAGIPLSIIYFRKAGQVRVYPQVPLIVICYEKKIDLILQYKEIIQKTELVYLLNFNCDSTSVWDADIEIPTIKVEETSRDQHTAPLLEEVALWNLEDLKD